MNDTKNEKKSSIDKSKIALKEIKRKVEISEKTEVLPRKKISFFEQLLNFFRRIYEKITK